MGSGAIGGHEASTANRPRAANPARVYDYLLGGKTNFEVDRRAARQLIRAKPAVARNVRANRAFLGRAARWCAGEWGIRQFLDIGAGIPVLSNTHEVVQAVRPDSRVVYVDNDKEVLLHARALLTSTPEGLVDFVLADLRQPDRILGL